MIHPSGIETSDFEIYEPNKLQIANAARRAKDHYVPRRSNFLLWFAILVSMVGAVLAIASMK